MNWKATLLLCLVFFATTLTLATYVANTALISLTSMLNTITADNLATLVVGIDSVIGDPVDNPVGPN